MKAILVIDEMPTGCIGCPCYYEDRGKCQNTWEEVEDDCTRPSWCPLKPLPHKLQADWYTDGYKEGFNACHEEITGETE